MKTLQEIKTVDFDTLENWITRSENTEEITLIIYAINQALETGYFMNDSLKKIRLIKTLAYDKLQEVKKAKWEIKKMQNQK